MFFFRHPQPFIRRPVAEQVVARKSEAPPATDLIIVDAVAPVPAMPAVPDAAPPLGEQGKV